MRDRCWLTIDFGCETDDNRYNVTSALGRDLIHSVPDPHCSLWVGLAPRLPIVSATSPSHCVLGQLASEVVAECRSLARPAIQSCD